MTLPENSTGHVVAEFGIDAPISLVNHQPKRQYLLAIVVVVALGVVPLWITRFSPLVDYPMYLARAYVLKEYKRVEFFQTEFKRVLAPMPNLATDMAVPPLLTIFAPEFAGKIFLSATVILFVFGCHILAFAIHGRPSWLAPLCGLFAYHSAFLYGFSNFSFSFALFLSTFGLWILACEKPSPAKRVGLALLAITIYLAHLAGLALDSTRSQNRSPANCARPSTTRKPHLCSVSQS